MAQTPASSPPGAAPIRKEEPDVAQEADIPSDDSTVEDDMTIEREDLPPASERG
jgi:hypothetical protein